MLPSEIPLFPLPNVVLFPAALLPLHIFEPRYRALVSDALESERLMGMVMLRPGWERGYEGAPPVYPIGCAGFISHADRLPDGRYNILLRGLEKFRIVQERPVRDGVETYRMARVEAIVEGTYGGPSSTANGLGNARAELERVIAKNLRRRAGESISKEVADEELVHAIAQHLEPLEKQALLECDGLLPRCRALIELLEMRTMSPQAGKTWRH